MIYSSTCGSSYPYSSQLLNVNLIHIHCKYAAVFDFVPPVLVFVFQYEVQDSTDDCVDHNSARVVILIQGYILSWSLMLAVDSWIRVLLDTECFSFPARGTSAVAHLLRACYICGSSHYSWVRIAREADLPSKEFSTCRLLVWGGHTRELHRHCSLHLRGSCGFDSSDTQSPSAGRI